MPGLFGTLDLGARSLQTQRQGIEVAGHNIANVNNPAYARQRLQIQTSISVDSPLGPQGTGAEGVAIVRLRSDALDRQIQNEISLSSYLESGQSALQFAQADLGQTIDRQSGTGAVAGQSSIADGLSDLFAGFQSVASAPSSLPDRQNLLMQAADLASRFNQVDQRLVDLQEQLKISAGADTDQVNKLLVQIAGLNDQISGAEANNQGTANDLRDSRQEMIEKLAKLVKVDVAVQSDGTTDISVGGTIFVSGKDVLDSLETYDAGAGRLMLRAANTKTPVTIDSGSIGGTISARDGQVASLREDLNSLASLLISKVNTVHSVGFNLSGGTGADFFTGTGAADIRVNPALLSNPSLFQASGVAGAAGDNKVASALAQLADVSHVELNNQTFSQNYAQTVASLGQALSSTNSSLQNQVQMQSMLAARRDSISGVSLDEEMTDMVKYQKAFEASARLVSVVNELLDTLIGMAR